MTDYFIEHYFTTGRTLLSWLIRFGSMGAHYSHVGARLPDGRMVAAHWDTGVSFQTLESEGYPRALSWATMKVPCTKEQSDRHTAWLLSQIGKPYDKRGILTMIGATERGWLQPEDWADSWFCSSFQFQAMREIALLRQIAVAPMRTVTPIELLWIDYALGGEFDKQK